MYPFCTCDRRSFGWCCRNKPGCYGLHQIRRNSFSRRFGLPCRFLRIFTGGIMDLKEIIKKNKQNVKNIIRLITKEEETDDLEQEVYVKVWKNSDRYKEQGSITGWINTIAKNVSKDYLKSAYRKRQDVTTSDDNVLVLIKDKKSTPENRLLKTERQKQILQAIQELKPKFKEVIVMCEINGYTYEECAQRLKCPIGTIKSRIYNAKKELAEILKDLL